MVLEPEEKQWEVNLFGNTKVITLEGTFTGTNAELRTFVAAINTKMSGTQAGAAYTGGLEAGSVTVIIQEFNWVYVKGAVLHVTYNLSLKLGTVIWKI